MLKEPNERRQAVLVVDDHEDSREVIVSALEFGGFEALGVGDAEGALEALRGASFDALITDLTLPGMSGERLAVRLRAGLGPRLLIATSGRDVAPEAETVFDKIYKKPLDLTALSADLGRLLAAPTGGAPVVAAGAPGPSLAARAGAPAGGAAPPAAGATPPAAGATPPAARAASPGAAKARLPADHYRLLVEHAPTMVWRAGLDAKCDWFNDTWLAFTGRALEQEVGDGWAEGVHPDDLQRCVDYYLENFGLRRAFEMEYRLRRFDGVDRWIFDRGVPFYDDSGSFAGFIGSCVDVDERRRADEARSRFLTTMGHELRTPLTPLAAYLYQLEGLAARGVVGSELVRKVSRQVGRIIQLVDDLAEVGRLELGFVMILNEEEADLAALVARAVDEQRAALARLPTSRAKPALELRAPGGPAPAWVDPSRVQQALRHVLANAVKFSASGGPIVVEVRALGDGFEIVVSDRGIGIPEPELGRVGTSYFRASNAPVANYPGVGMGLAMTKRIITSHGGALLVESAPGRGTTVRLTLSRRARGDAP